MGRKLVVLGFPLVFIAGWLAGAHRSDPTPLAEAASTPPAATTTACIDSAAMQANANLVAQLHDSKAQLKNAQAIATASAAKVIETETAPPSSLVVSKDEWSRMGTDGVFRVRVPCSSWEGFGRSQLVSPNGRTRGVVRAGGAGGSARALVAGLSEEETKSIEPAYAKVQKRTWSKIEAACRQNESFREWTTEHPPETDAERIDACRMFLLGDRDERRPTVQRVAQLLAARAPFDRAERDSDRVLFATAQSSEELWKELEATMGREKAKRLAEGGVLCLDETVYDVRLPKDDPS